MNKIIQMMSGFLPFSVVAMSILVAAPLHAAPPTTLHYQGYLTEPIGTPIDATVDIAFALYDDPVTAAPLWAELHNVTVDTGLFSVVLGTLTPIELSFDTQMYLGITVGTDTELAPRLPLGATAKTFRSATAEAVIEGGVIAVMIADGAVTPEKLAPVCNVGEVFIMTATGWSCGATPCVPQSEVCDGLDNDCNNLIDDGTPWANKGAPCSAGAGQCAAQGLFVCDAADPGGPTVCSAVPGDPTTEACDGLDNDCDGEIDNGLAAELCTDQEGACAGATATCGGLTGFLECTAQNFGPDYEFGEFSCDGIDNDCDGTTDEDLLPLPCDLQAGVCTGTVQTCGGSGGWQACAAADYGPAYEPVETICDGLDNDCDATVDEGFLNPNTGQYDSQDACGSCGNSCTGQFPNAVGFCDAGGPPVCAFSCATGFYDLNLNPFDGCEFAVDPDGIYSSEATGTDVAGCGIGPLSPCATLQFAIGEAQALSRSNVYVADGVYLNLTLVNGISLHGAYRPDTWQRHVATTQTIIRSDGTDPFTRTVIAEGITLPTVFDGFVVEGRDSQSPGGNSYALWVRDSESGLTITNNVIVAGDGSDGPTGDDGLAAQAAFPGSDGVDALDLFDTYGIDLGDCTIVHHSPGGTGGLGMCGPTRTDGGDGGDRVCPDFFDGSTVPPVASEDGASGSNGGALGGVAGRDTYQTSPCNNANLFGETDGTPGADGTDGNAGGLGAGCVNSSGATNLGTGLWIPGGAGSGQPGSAAGGGGGGGSGAGAYIEPACTDSHGGDNLGGTGGGGGAGGCGGSGGFAGTSGGGSFALFVSFLVSPGGNVPTVIDNVIYRGAGGDGGHGGFGSVGALGGAGGSGGTGSFIGNLFPSFPGGAGGAGGDGGHGGGGGGGCGGPSYGIYFAAGTVPPEISAWTTDNLFPSGGSAGTGGPGGGSLGNPGGDGAEGVTGETNF